MAKNLLSNEMLAMLLETADTSKMSDKQKAMFEQTKTDAADTLARSEAKRVRDAAVDGIAENVKPVIDKLSTLDIPACIDVVTLKYSYDKETGFSPTVKKFLSEKFAFDPASDELASLVAAVDTPEILKDVLNLDEVLLDDLEEFVKTSLGVSNSPQTLFDHADSNKITTTVRALGIQRYDAILSQNDWADVSSIITEYSANSADFNRDVDMPEESAAVTIYYNSDRVVSEANGKETAGGWNVSVKIGKGVSASTGQRASSSRIHKIADGRTLREYAEQEFYGKDSPHYDEKLTEIVDEKGWNGNGKWNISKQLTRIETNNPNEPQLYTEAKEKADAEFEGKE